MVQPQSLTLQTYSIRKVLVPRFVLWDLDSFVVAAFRFREKQWEIHTMGNSYNGHVSPSLRCPPIDGTFSGRLQLKFSGLLGKLCVSQFVIQVIYLQKIGTRLDLLCKALGK